MPEEAPVVPYYSLQVRTGDENKYLRLAGPAVESREGALLWPRRSLRIRKQGRFREVLAPIFPGYIFLRVPQIAPELYWALKEVPGFLRFLKSNQNIQPLSERDARMLGQILRFGEVVGRSLASFDENNRIRVIEGPLKGFEGAIVKVDKRKGRARVKLDLYDEAHLVDFGFTALEKKTDD